MKVKREELASLYNRYRPNSRVLALLNEVRSEYLGGFQKERERDCL